MHNGIIYTAALHGAALCALCSLVSFQPLNSQSLPDFRITQIGSNEGLPHSFVNSLMIGSKGFLWVGTRDGLARYDGTTFTTFAQTRQGVDFLCEDSAGTIWLSEKDNGLTKMDRATLARFHYSHAAGTDHGLPNEVLTGLLTDGEGRVWVAARSELARYDSDRNRFISYRPGDGIVGVSGKIQFEPNSLFLHSETHSLLACGKVRDTRGERSPLVLRYNDQSDVFENITPSQAIDNGWVSFARQTRLNDSSLLVEVRNRTLAEIDARDGTLRRLFNISFSEPTSTYLTYFRYVRPGRDIWIKTNDRTGELWGLYRIPFSAFHYDSLRSPPRYVASYIDRTPIIHGHIHQVVEDRHGIIWVGTNSGLYKLTPRRYLFPEPIAAPSINGSGDLRNHSRSIFRDSHGDLWIGYDQGLLQIRAGSGERIEHTFRNNRDGNFYDSQIHEIGSDIHGEALFGGNGHLSRLNKESGRPEKIPVPLDESDRVWTILLDRSQRLWIGGNSHIRRLDSTFRLLAHDTLGAGEEANWFVWTSIEDRAGRIWLGTNQGLLRWDESRKRYRRYLHDPANSASILPGEVWGFLEDRRGRLWIALYYHGLCEYRPKTDDFAVAPINDELPSYGICGLAEDQHGRIWISHSKGLTRWDPETDIVRHYTTSDGLPGNEFTLKTTWRDADGKLWFGASDGVIGFYPDSLADNPFPPQLLIVDVSVNDSLIYAELGDGDTIELNYDRRYLSFRPVALDLLSPQGNRVRYRTEGLDEDWISPVGSSRISYAGLAPGVYRIRLTGANSHGVWNRDGITITIIIHPPWWGTLWFRLSALALLVVATALVTRTRINGERRREQERHELTVKTMLQTQEDERRRIARDLHDSVGQTLATASVTLQIFESRKGTFRPTERDAYEQSLSMVRNAAGELREICHALGSSTLRELGLREALRELVDSLNRGRSPIAFILESPQKLPRFDAQIETNLFRILQELIANALKYSEASSVAIRLEANPGSIRVRVTDDGKGFDTGTATPGMGLHNIRARAESIHGQVAISSTPGVGTDVVVEVVVSS